MSTQVQEHSVDCSNAARGVWLVKVPKYISERWQSAPGSVEVGRLKITKSPGQKPNVSFSLSEAVLAMEREPIPKEHRFVVSNVGGQTLGVFSQTQPSDRDAVVPEREALAIEGKVIQRAECRPLGDASYMQLKRDKIKRAAQPGRRLKTIGDVVHIKPVANHQHNIDHQKRKKEVGKKMRDDKEKVLAMLFAAFEKHQFYNIKDLVRITMQPVTYLKEVLSEVCNYNMKSPHRNMYELKPEYRHYSEEKEEEEGDE
ncbi:general transcription factor IIF subunit 2-like [Amphibalanus amphitrite]|uniref:general transcription factor IIF subunit 2-like n=1 Tax=Amphibalanus amphitrite TaxID=1232801 RepID=UPI001C9260D0|nr:general transcription factor IIF subunit 2-like [Amphibalanus amphitrite]XP_043216618.1 general transcription factor IIF subunit 2-like [Amphibalanus amphitrite]XP_043216619.1 general transcription factor IIF subunit 2-like [Amphibalanus amphitrite]XP_043216620.1 general transcription factor IIF subunit 2-like [Amphibalanus amphitrite]XP_043216621.1 general transcription factor IIF subunit 2-like [Amphibalanus amphitrite]XP_043216622.1 general transcription factor IIF subunit 2-like [Amphib